MTNEQLAFIEKVSNSPIYQGIVKMLLQQTLKGYEKYGHTLDDCPDDKFDWRLMAMEELIDLVQYQQKEIVRLEKDNSTLRDNMIKQIEDVGAVALEYTREIERLERLLNP